MDKKKIKRRKVSPKRKNNKYFIMSSKTFAEMKGNLRLFLLTAVFAAGILAGAAFLRNAGFAAVGEKLMYIADSYKKLKCEQSFFQNFCYSMITEGLLLITSVFWGFSAIGSPLVCVLPFIKGLGIGFFCGYLYSEYGLHGLGYSMLMIVPAQSIANLTLIASCNESCKFSLSVCEEGILASPLRKEETRLYLLKHGVYLIMMIASSLIGAAFCSIFSSFFG